MKHESTPIPNTRTDARVWRDVAGFKNTSHIDKQLGIMQELEELGLESALYFAGAMSLDIASSNPELDVEQRIGLFSNAQTNWQNAISMRNILSSDLDGYSQRSGLELACLPLHAAIVIDGKNPDLETIQSTFNRILGMGQRSITAASRTSRSKDKSSIVRNQDLRGGISEISVLLLLHRFALRTLADNSWVATTSLLSQDRATRHSGSAESGAWDISGFTQTDEQSTPELSYKIQVKTRGEPNGLVYSDDISQVAVRKDLSFDRTGKRDMAFDAIIRECIAEQEGDDKASFALDGRTGLLLDILG